MKVSASKKPGSNGLPVPPPGLGREARALWIEVTSGWSLDPAALTILATACSALSQSCQADALVRREGFVLADRWGQRKPHPGVSIARDAKSTFMRAMKLLALDVEPILPVGRPPGR